MKKIGVEIIFKNGKKDCIDPVYESAFDLMVKSGKDKYLIKNDLYEYEYRVCDIEKIEKYDLFDCCGFDVRSGHKSNCENN